MTQEWCMKRNKSTIGRDGCGVLFFYILFFVSWQYQTKIQKHKYAIPPDSRGLLKTEIGGPHNYYSCKSVTVAAGVRLVVVNITTGANPADWYRFRVAHKNNCLRIPQGCVTFRRWGPVVLLTKLDCRCYVTFPKSMAGCTGLREELVVKAEGVDCWSRWLTHGKVRKLTRRIIITIILLSRQFPSTMISLPPRALSSCLTE